MNLAQQLESRLPPELLSHIQAVGEAADLQKKRAVIVGGVVRDLMLDRAVLEADVMMESPLDAFVRDIAKNRGGKVVSHERFLTFTIHFPSGAKIDFVTARHEFYIAPAELPTVSPASIEKDLKRRDFTINALAACINRGKWGEVYDPLDGKRDIAQKLIKILHPLSFQDDPTRIYRAARFAGRLGFKPDKDTLDYLLRAVRQKMPQRLSPVRRRHEFELLLKESDPLPALRLLESWDALACLHPEWKLMPQHKKLLTKPPSSGGGALLARRLAGWLSPWGAARAREMMTSLDFERAVKKQVLDELNRRVGSA